MDIHISGMSEILLSSSGELEESSLLLDGHESSDGLLEDPHDYSAIASYESYQTNECLEPLYSVSLPDSFKYYASQPSVSYCSSSAQPLSQFPLGQKEDTVHCNSSWKRKAIDDEYEQNDSENGPRSCLKRSRKRCVESRDQESNVDTEVAVNSSGKSRARRGSATDPQSIYARKRRERINERLKILQNLVPNGTKVDISTMLEQAIQYVKFMQLQIKLLSSDEHWMFTPVAFNGVISDNAELAAKMNGSESSKSSELLHESTS